MTSFKKIVVENTNDFYAKIEEAKQQASNVFVLFTGAGNPSGCGDCNRAHPIIEKVMKETTDSVLVECPCEREAYRDKQNFVYRKDNKIKLTCVPTLMNWSNPAIRLDDSQSSQEDLVRELLLGDD